MVRANAAFQVGRKGVVQAFGKDWGSEGHARDSITAHIQRWKVVKVWDMSSLEAGLLPWNLWGGEFLSAV